MANTIADTAELECMAACDSQLPELRADAIRLRADSVECNERGCFSHIPPNMRKRVAAKMREIAKLEE